jgi:uncharacterized membrane protein
MNDGARHDLEHRADVARARLLGALDKLDRRRQELFDWKLQLRRHSGELFGAFGGIVAGIALTAGVVAYRVSSRERRLRRERWRAVDRLWRHPERLAARETLLGAAARMILVAGVTMAITTVGMSQLERLRRRPRLPRHPTEPLGV